MFRKLGVTVHAEELCILQRSIELVGKLSRHLNHEGAVRAGSNTCDMDSTRRQMDRE